MTGSVVMWSAMVLKSSNSTWSSSRCGTVNCFGFRDNLNNPGSSNSSLF